MCANMYRLINHERSQLVADCVKGGALEFYLKEINKQKPYQMVVDKLRLRYNMTLRNLSLQSKDDSLSFDDFIAQHQRQDERECLRRMVEYLNNITSQLVDCYRT